MFEDRKVSTEICVSKFGSLGRFSLVLFCLFLSTKLAFPKHRCGLRPQCETFVLSLRSYVVRLFRGLPTVLASGHVPSITVTRLWQLHARKILTSIHFSLIAQLLLRSKLSTPATYSLLLEHTAMMYSMQYMCSLTPQTNSRLLRTAFPSMPFTYAAETTW